MNKIDFRSDTVTWPTPEMREAMATAEVGDDVYGEDPTIIELEALAAEMLGKEAGCLVTSGTQGNLTSMLTHANRGDEAIIGEDAHVFQWEAGGMAVLGGILPKPLPTDEIGRMDLDQVRAAVRGDNDHWPTSRLICVENSSGGNYGAAIGPEYFAGIRAIADEHHLKVHLDGARLFNATTALEIDPRSVTQYVDSVTVCLSKGLSAPVGSVIAGSHNFIKKAKRNRKLLGGGMRQGGVIAAAGLIALRDMTQRLAVDHQNAKRLAHGLAQMPAIDIDPAKVYTNMVFFRLTEEARQSNIVQTLKDEFNIWIGGYPQSGLFRAVTHFWITEKEVDLLLEAMRAIFEREFSY